MTDGSGRSEMTLSHGDSGRLRCVGADEEFDFVTNGSLLALFAYSLAPPDVTIFNTSGHGGAFSQAMARICKLRGRSYVAMIGGINYSLSPRQLSYYQDADSIIVHTQQLRKALAQEPALRDSNIKVLPLGVDCDHFEPGTPSMNLGAPALLYVGRVVEAKGIHHLVDVLREVRKHHTTVRLNIVGPQPDEGYLRRLKGQAKDAELDNAVQFHGIVPHDQLPAWYQSADLSLLASQSEGFGMVIVESMACGTPVVALHAPGGIGEIIEHQVTGLVVDPEEFGNAISKLLMDRVQLGKFGQAARQQAVSTYSQKGTTEKLCAIIERAAGQDTSTDE